MRSLLVVVILFLASPQSGQRNAVEKRMTKMDELAGRGGVGKLQSSLFLVRMIVEDDSHFLFVLDVCSCFLGTEEI